MGRLITRLGLLLVAAGLAGCDLLTSVFGSSTPPPALQPRQVMLASAPATPVARGVLVSTYAIPHGFQDVGIEESTVVGDGGMLPTEGARPFTSPGIAANDSMYVVVFWGGQPRFNFLHVFTSESGRFQTWVRAGNFFNASSSQIDNRARPALTFFPSTNTWFYAFRDASTGRIVVDQLDVRHTSRFDSRGNSVYNATWITRVDTGFATALPPALSYIGTTLVLAFTNPGGTVSIAVPTNAPGSDNPLTNPYTPAFGAPVVATTTVAAAQLRNSTAVVSDIGAPYLQNILENLYLATARETPQGSVDIHVLQSGDGTTWNAEVATVRGVAATLLGPVYPSIAGPVSEMVVAYGIESTAGITVTVNGGPVSLAAQSTSVGATYGPGPSLAERLTCADPVLIARTSSGDTPIPAGGGVPTEVSTNGDVTLLCGANATITPGCPASTSLVTIRRPRGAPTFALQCWPR